MEGTFIDGKYEILRQLGQGGMGTVYEARHRTTGRKVALKVIAPEALAKGADVIARFQREVRASGAIDSPYVVQVFDAGLDKETGSPYMVMECLAGEDVLQVLRRVGPLATDVVLRLAAQACHGLQIAHAAGIVHRDIKSANLFLARRGGESTELITKILDFGIAKVRANAVPSGEDHHLTKTGSMLGSPAYMSPEQAIGANDLDGRSDIFSLGIMMYEALCGSTPNGHLESLGALVIAVCSQSAPPLQDRAPWVAPEVAAIVHKALARDPGDRFQTAAELRDAIVALLAGGDTKLTEEMLAPLSADAKSLRASRAGIIPYETPAAVLHAPTVISVRPSALASTPANLVPGSVGAAPSLAVTPAPVRRRPMVGIAAVAAVIAICGGGGVVFARYESAKVARQNGLVPEAPPSASVSAAPIDSVPREMLTVSLPDAMPPHVEIAPRTAAPVPSPTAPARSGNPVRPMGTGPIPAASATTAPRASAGAGIDRTF